MFCTYCGTFLTWIMYLTDVIYIICLLAEHIGVTPSPLVVVIAACVLVCVSELLKRRWRNM